MKSIHAPIVLTLALACALAAPHSAQAAGLVLTCQTLDPGTQAARVLFSPGDEMLVRFRLDVPAEAAGREVSVKLAARARIAGISIPYTLDELSVSVPNESPIDETESEIPWSGSVSESSLVEIPNGFPPGTYSLRLKAAIDGIGKQACEIQVQVAAASGT